MNIHRRLCLVAAVTVAIASTTAAGMSGPASAATTPAGNIAKAKATAAQFMVAPKKILQTVPLPKTPPKGKSLIFISNSEPTVVQIQHALGAAVQAAGWTYKVIDIDVANPATLVSALNTALAEHPTVVSVTSLPPSLFGASTIAAYTKAGVPIIVQGATPVTTTKTILGTPGGPATDQLAATGMANWFIADSKGKGQALVEHVPGYSILTPFTDTFQAIVKKECPGCTVKMLNLSLPQVSAGQTVPVVVSTLKTNPGMNYLIADNADFLTGINSALNAAGISGIKIAGQILTTTNTDALRNGTQAAWMGYNPFYVGYSIMDMALRWVEKVPISNQDNASPTQLVTPANVGNLSVFNRPTNALQQFEKLWKVPLTKCTPLTCGAGS